MAGTRTLSTQSVRVSIALAMVLCFAACDSPQPPGLCGSIPEQTLFVGESATVNFCFDDPDEDMLDFLLVSSDPGIVTAVATGSTATVTAISPGNALVTMIATDPTGLKAQQSFRVVVPNRAPVAVGTIADREVMVGDSATVDVSGHFSEPDGQGLSYAATVSDSAVADVSVAGAVVTIVATAKGEVTVTVTATDPGGLAAMQSFRVTVPNRPPMAVDTIPGDTIQVGGSITVDLSSYFDDPDGDTLTYAATSSLPGVAGVSVSGSTLTVTALAKGEAVVTVTATDTEGLAANQEFTVTVPNRAPMAVDTIPAQMLFRGEMATLDLTPYFIDPDGDSLAYSAATSDAAVVTVSTSGGSATVNAVAQGEATVTITAVDTEGLGATQAFAVTVPNRAPLVADTLPPVTIHTGDTVTIDLTPHFSDADGDSLVYVATTSDSSVVTAAVAGDSATVIATGKGQTTVTVTATDPYGLTSEQSFAVTVPNRGPIILAEIPPQTIYRRETARLDLSDYFGDPDGDTLVYSVAISNRRVATVRISSGTIIIRAASKGEAVVTVTATDPDNLTNSQSFPVTVPNRGPVAVGVFPDLTIGDGETTTLAISNYFNDPDGDKLTYAGGTADARIARASIFRTSLTLTGVSEGRTTLTLTATDPDNLEVTQRAQVTVTSGVRAPRPVGRIAAQTIAEGRNRSLPVSQYFQDPDGDPLTYEASTSNRRVATASASGGTVTIRAVSDGQTTLSVTASDPDGLTTTQTTQVTVVTGRQGPVAVGEVPKQVLVPRDDRNLDVSPYFQDPDGGSMSYKAVSSDVSVVSASVSRATVRLRGVAVGTATVTITATDSDGLTATQDAEVEVAGSGQRPVAVGTLSDLDLTAGHIITFDVSTYFRDPDGDPLAFEALSSDAAVSTASASGSSVTVRAVAQGKASLTITARNPGGLTATQTADVEVAGKPAEPVAVGTIPDGNIQVGEAFTLDVSHYFDHPGGDPLTYTASASDDAIVFVDIQDSELEVKGVGFGTATVTVVATDQIGQTASHDFDVTVADAVDTGYRIEVRFASSVGTSARPAILGAASFWEAVLADNEFFDYNVGGLASCGGYSTQVGTIDDLLILVGTEYVDGPRGNLGYAGYCIVRTSGEKPILGRIVFDEDDIDRIERTGDLTDVAIHEIAHVLGFGINWDDLGLLANPSGSNADADTHFTGSEAITAFNQAGGTSYGGAKVPVENGGDDSHWRKSVFGLELMTPTLRTGVSDPLSAISLQAFSDMGYAVRSGLADSYRLPGTVSALDIEGGGRVLDLSNDVRIGPVVVVDENGRIVRVIPN